VKHNWNHDGKFDVGRRLVWMNRKADPRRWCAPKNALSVTRYDQCPNDRADCACTVDFESGGGKRGRFIVADWFFDLRVLPANPLRFDSPAESALWDELYRDRSVMFPWLPEPQYRVGKYRIDFGFPRKKLGIEVDGLAFHGSQATFIRDQKRQRYIESEGWRLLRFAAKEVLTDARAVVVEIAKTVDA
jgi:very-short-patch-repair endonuclease